jgi:ABC-2 type transport system ATP-binding protein
VDEGLISSVFKNQAIHSGPTTWKFETEDPESLKKQILQFTLDHNLNVVSLQSDTTNLEDIFRSLTA